MVVGPDYMYHDIIILELIQSILQFQFCRVSFVWEENSNPRFYSPGCSGNSRILYISSTSVLSAKNHHSFQGVERSRHLRLCLWIEGTQISCRVHLKKDPNLRKIHIHSVLPQKKMMHAEAQLSKVAPTTSSPWILEFQRVPAIRPLLSLTPLPVELPNCPPSQDHRHPHRNGEPSVPAVQVEKSQDVQISSVPEIH